MNVNKVTLKTQYFQELFYKIVSSGILMHLDLDLVTITP